MKPIYTHPLNLLTYAAAFLLLAAPAQLHAQACATAQGNQTTYGTNNVWIGYVYTGKTLSSSNYQGYVNEGTSSSPNFNEGFGGGGVTYNTNGCSITTDNFSVRYMLQETLAAGTYIFTVGGDDGYRFSMNSDSSYMINNWNDHSYTTTTDTVTLTGGTYNFILEYYQDGGANEVSFNLTEICVATGNQTIYGTNNVWIGYMYQGMNFQTYKGTMNEGSSASPFFDENFGNTTNVNTDSFATSVCKVVTYQFSAIYRLTQTLSAGNYTFTIGGDDGYKMSLDGGNTWPINRWQDQSYVTTAYSTWLPAGSYNMVIEYYDNGGADRITYNNTFTALPVTISNWSATLQPGDKALLQWTTSNAVNFDHFIVQRSTDAENFQDIGTVAGATADSGSTNQYAYTDQFTYNGDVYYRLASVDRNGAISYSAIVSLPMQMSSAIHIFPTVVDNGQLTIETPTAVARARMQLFDMTGRELLAQEWSELQGRQQVTLTGSGHLPAGAYIVRLTGNQSGVPSELAKQIIIIK